MPIIISIIKCGLTSWQARPTLKPPHQLTKNPLADRKRRGKSDACQCVNALARASDLKTTPPTDKNPPS